MTSSTDPEPYPDGTVLVDIGIGGPKEPCPICGLLVLSKHVHQLPVKDAGGWFYLTSKPESK